jgi:hypothetical protein
MVEARQGASVATIMAELTHEHFGKPTLRAGWKGFWPEPPQDRV